MGERRRWAAGVALAVAGAAAVLPLPARAAGPTVVDGCVQSVPEEGTSAPTPICYTLYRPAEASAEHPVPVIFHSHGWGGARERGRSAFGDWLGAGFGVISFDQRGFGDSGGFAHIEDPDFEGQDVSRLIDLVASLDWVAKDGPDDPRIGAIGGSYGGGYQFVGALTELRDRGATRFDALAPEITWHDLRQSLAPNGVVRTLWVLLLYVAGLPSDAHLPLVTESLLEGTVTGMLPVRLSAFLENNGPAWHVANGRTLDIPVLFGQGITDNLFPLDQGLRNFQRALTPAARARSIFVGYNGGHVLPSLLPASIADGGDPCSDRLMADVGGGGFGALSRRFFAEELLGRATGLGGRGRYHLATQDGRCVTVDSTEADRAVPLGSVVTTAGVGLPQAYEVARGPLVVAGTPTVDADVTSLALDGRAFLGLSVGPDPLAARVVGNNLLPLHEPLPVMGEHRRIELPSVAVDVPAGQSLYLTVSPLSDSSIGHGSRLPGLITLERAVVNLPVVEPPPAPEPEPEPPAPAPVADPAPATTGTDAVPTAVAGATAERGGGAPARPATRTATTPTTEAPAATVAGDAEAGALPLTPASSPGSGDDGVPAGLVGVAVAALALAAVLWVRMGFARL